MFYFRCFHGLTMVRRYRTYDWSGSVYFSQIRHWRRPTVAARLRYGTLAALADECRHRLGRWYPPWWEIYCSSDLSALGLRDVAHCVATVAVVDGCRVRLFLMPKADYHGHLTLPVAWRSLFDWIKRIERPLRLRSSWRRPMPSLRFWLWRTDGRFS